MEESKFDPVQHGLNEQIYSHGLKGLLNHPISDRGISDHPAQFSNIRRKSICEKSYRLYPKSKKNKINSIQIPNRGGCGSGFFFPISKSRGRFRRKSSSMVESQYFKKMRIFAIFFSFFGFFEIFEKNEAF